MCAGVGGSPAGATLMAALAVGAGQSGGAREVFLVVQAWAACGTDLDAWRALIDTRPAAAPSVWPELDHPPGFDPHARRTAGTVVQMLDGLARHSSGPALPWLAAQREALEAASGRALSATAVAAAAFVDLGFSAEQAEMLFLLMRLPGAAAHALEQRALGHKNFPFFSLDLLDDPARKAA
jgi:citrate synthase